MADNDGCVASAEISQRISESRLYQYNVNIKAINKYHINVNGNIGYQCINNRIILSINAINVA